MLCAVLMAGAGHAAAPPADPQALFAQAVEADLGHGGHPDAARAFNLYNQAATAGLAAAQLNVAVMLDSGRGVRHDAAGAATYYSLAASQGVARAAYDMGQLYADGEGVPANPDLARAWLLAAAAEGISAARTHLAGLHASDAARPAGPPTPPSPVLPKAGSVVLRPAPLQFVWTAAVQPVEAQFYLEVATLEGAATHDVYTAQVAVSAVTAKLDTPPGRYAWRVFTVCQALGRYVPSPWVAFSIL